MRSIAFTAVLAIVCLCFPCGAGRMTAPADVASIHRQLHVTRQVEATDELGKPFAKVFVKCDNGLEQEGLDSMVTAGNVPELLFTDPAQKALFQVWKDRSFPIELHVDAQAGSAELGEGGDVEMQSSGTRTIRAGPKDWSEEEGIRRQPEKGTYMRREEEEEEMSYVESHGKIGVHELMLKDGARCSWYQREIERACSHVKDAVVLDVGAGTGLLSLFAARAGAKRVYAVESNTRMAGVVAQLAVDNKLEHIITVLPAKLETLNDSLVTEHVDILVSEWMGFYLLHESMLDSVLTARDRFLKRDTGIIIPSSAHLVAAPVSLPALWARKVDFWTQHALTYGLNYSSVAALASEELSASPQIETLDVRALLAPESVVWSANLTHLRAQDLAVVGGTPLEFKIKGKQVHGAACPRALHGVCLWFQVGGPSAGELRRARRGPGTVCSAELGAVEGAKEGETVGAPRAPRGAPRARHVGAMRSIPEQRPRAEARGAGFRVGEGWRDSVEESVGCLSTGPADAETHWKQTVVALPQPLVLRKAVNRVECCVTLRRVQGGRQYALGLTVSEVESVRELLERAQDEDMGE